MFGHTVGKFLRSNIQGLIPGNFLKFVRFFGPVQGLCQAVLMLHEFPEFHALHADITQICS